MPRRSLLSAEQHARLFDVPITPAEMAKHYVLSPDDLLLLRAKRRSVNRLGFAVQFCLLRYPGQGLGPGQQPPTALLDFVAAQLGTPATAFSNCARCDQTRREHAAELQAILGLRSFRLGDWRDCLRVGTDAAWSTDRGEPIVQAMLTHFRVRGMLVPDAAVLERIGLAARARARQRTFQLLGDGITEAEQVALDGLLVTDPAVRRSRFAWLRDAPEAPAPGNMTALLDRLDWVRGVGIARERTARVHSARLVRLVEEGGIISIETLGQYSVAVEDPRCSGKAEHRLIEVLVVAVYAVIACAESWDDIALHGCSKLAWFRPFLELAHGIPSHDTGQCVFMLIDPDAFEAGFAA